MKRFDIRSDFNSHGCTGEKSLFILAADPKRIKYRGTQEDRGLHAPSLDRYQPPSARGKNEVVEALNRYTQAMYDTGCEPALSQP